MVAIWKYPFWRTTIDPEAKMLWELDLAHHNSTAFRYICEPVCKKIISKYFLRSIVGNHLISDSHMHQYTKE